MSKEIGTFFFLFILTSVVVTAYLRTTDGTGRRTVPTFLASLPSLDRAWHMSKKTRAFEHSAFDDSVPIVVSTPHLNASHFGKIIYLTDQIWMFPHKGSSDKDFPNDTSFRLNLKDLPSNKSQHLQNGFFEHLF